MGFGNLMREAVFHAPTRIIHGAGRAAELSQLIEDYECTRPLIVTDQGVRRVGFVDEMAAALGDAGLEAHIFDAVKPNPDTQVAAAAAAAAAEAGADAVIGIGGGSSLDTAKAAAVVAAHGGKAADYFGVDTVPGPPLPVFAVPTTAGTGSEVTNVAVVTDPHSNRKMVIVDAYVPPVAAILDPELLTSLPPRVIAETGMDSLTHAVEAYISRASTPVTDALASQAIRLVGQHLRRFYFEPEDVEAAGGMLLASCLAALSFSNAKLGVVHALSHPVSCYYGLAHGLANAVLLPYCMEYNLPSCRPEFAAVGHLLGDGRGRRGGTGRGERGVEAVWLLADDLGLPERYADVGVDEEHLEPMVADALESRVLTFNPRSAGAHELRAIYRRAIHG